MYQMKVSVHILKIKSNKLKIFKNNLKYILLIMQMLQTGCDLLDLH